MLWTEKYRPTKLMHVVGQPNFVLDAEHWVTNQEMPNVLLYGVAGVGKTAAALSLANDMLGDDVKANFFEINASDDRKLETVRTRIKEIASTSKIGEAPFKIILLDEMDGMTRDAQNALKRIMERYAANYSFKRLNNDAIRNVIFDVLEKERVTHISEDDLEIFIGSLHGDLRRGLTELQAAVSSKSSLLNMIDKQLMPYTELLELVNNNEYTNAVEKVHNLLYDSVEMKAICVGLHDTIIKTDMTHGEKFKLLRVVGEAEWRSSSMTPKVLASWMIGQMI